MPLSGELARIGRMLSQWQAQLKFVFWSSIAMGCLWLFGFSDIFLQFGRLGRLAAWGVLVALIAVMFSQISKVLSQKHTVFGVAATIEKAFPRLDNHLINYLQFSVDRNKDVFKEAYVRRGVPEWRGVNINEMKNRKVHLRALLVLAVAIISLGAPVAVKGRMWTVALWRIVNPFSNCQPVSLTNIVGVEPGNTTVLQGNPIVLSCRVQGMKGHHVRLDIKPSDDDKKTYDIGKISGDGIEEFPYRIAKVTTDTKYRFRAGDAPFPEWFQVKTRLPLAFTRIDLTVKPPAYTTLRPRTFDGMADEVEVPQGSKVDVSLACNLPLTSASLMVKGLAPVAMKKAGDEKTWSGSVDIKEGNAIKLAAGNTYKEKKEACINFKLLPDLAPVIQILVPKGRTKLAANSVPSIQFSVFDDLGLTDVAIERIVLGSRKKSGGNVLKRWPISHKQQFEEIWQSTNRKVKEGESLAFRVLATDNCPFGKHESKSPPIIFDTVSVERLALNESKMNNRISSILSKLIDLQQENLCNTRKFKDAIDLTKAASSAVASAKAEQWNQAAGQQKLIRQLAGKLLRNPLRPLGGMTPSVKELYMEEMFEVIKKLDRIPGVKGGEKIRLAEKSVSLEETILRKLTYTEIAADKTKRRRKISGLLAMLGNLIKGETKVLASTKDYIKQNTPVGETLIDEQDSLASKTSDFVRACNLEAPTLESTDKKFADLILQVAKQCETKQVRQNMLRASAKLDDNTPKQAVPHEQSAIAVLKELQELLNKWHLSNAQEETKEMVDALHEAKEKIKRLRKLESKVIEAMKAIERQTDKSNEERDLMEEDIEELQKNIKEAFLEVPKDLHIFPELPVANELIEDVFSVFEEMEQPEGSKTWGADHASDTPYLKEISMIEAMDELEDEIANSEKWLAGVPDYNRVLQEPFDKEEMPAVLALGALHGAVEDLIGDMIEELEEHDEATDDAATNFQQPDFDSGWGVKEGELETFSADGVSGNQKPDHKEQSGRSNVGRQGQAIGETAAGGGTIGEGDKNIEKRFTPEPLQSGQVQVDGEADEMATGGGKQGAGAADDYGMPGHGGERRMDSTAQGSLDGLGALMAKTKAAYLRCSLLNLRTDSLGAAAHHMRQANDAIAAGLPISQVREHQRQAMAALKRAKTELSSGVTDSIDEGQKTAVLADVVEGGADQAPRIYKELVAEYFKSLSESI